MNVVGTLVTDMPVDYAGVGNLLSEHLALSFEKALLLAGLIAAVTKAYYLFKLNAVTALGVAYALTCPLGASLGDLMIQAPDDGGLSINKMIINMGFFSAR